MINKSTTEVFDFIIDPANAHLWIDNVRIENANEWPPRVDTVYCRQNKDSNKSSFYIVQRIVKDKIFELVLKGGDYHICYRCFSKDSTTSFQIFEWVDKGELEDPFKQEVVQKLKSIMESS